MSHFILAVDQGTTSTRSILFDADLREVARAQLEVPQHFPHAGWVEHDARDLWQTSLDTARSALQHAGISASALAGIGITNQRETLVVWDRQSGEPVCPAIVWQDRRTADLCNEWAARQDPQWITERTGLLLDPYFTASKLHWVLQSQPHLRRRAEAGEVLAGTVDSWLIWKLTAGRAHVTDASNAARTLLFDIHRQCWDDDLLAWFDLPRAMLPEVVDNACEFGLSEPSLLGAAVPIRGSAGDQQAALLGQACLQPGMVKSTYGTGCFIVQNTGTQAVQSAHRLLSTVAYRLDGQVCYALEGAIFIAGAAVQWLRDGLGVIASAAQTQTLAEQARSDSGVYLVPAFVGLGAPHWLPEARGALLGLTRDTGPAELARAALESVAYQTRDLLAAMQRDIQQAQLPQANTPVLRVDGGMTASDWMLQFLADILDCPVDRPPLLETTALGAAWLAGLQAGLYPQADRFMQGWECQQRFLPRMDHGERQSRCQGWERALARVLMQP